MQCPSCAGTLVRHDHRHNGFVHMDECEKCHGCWLEHAELESLEAGVWADLDEMGMNVADALSDMVCPQCSTRLTALGPAEGPTLTVDRCPGCHGIWLDRGELKRIEAVLDEYAHAHGETLQDRPAAWSRLHWAAYRALSLGARGGPTTGGSGWA